MEVPVGEALIGRVVNPLGQPVDGLVISRQLLHVQLKHLHQALCNVNQFLEPLKLVLKRLNASVPIPGRGQRELIIGDLVKQVKHPLRLMQIFEPKRTRYDLYLCCDWSKRINCS